MKIQGVVLSEDSYPDITVCIFTRHVMTFFHSPQKSLGDSDWFAHASCCIGISHYILSVIAYPIGHFVRYRSSRSHSSFPRAFLFSLLIAVAVVVNSKNYDQ